MKRILFLSGALLCVSCFFWGCSTPAVLPKVPSYEPLSEKYDTSAVIEYLPHSNAVLNRIMIDTLKKHGYQVQQKVSYHAAVPSDLYVLTVVDWQSKEYSGKKHDIMDTSLIVMVRRPGTVFGNGMFTGQVRYFQSSSQLAVMGKKARMSGLELAIEHLFMINQFRKALEAEKNLPAAAAPGNTAPEQYQAVRYYQSPGSFDLYQAVRWAFLAMDKGSCEAERYIAENCLYGELFSDKKELERLAVQTPAGQYRLGEIYEFAQGVPQDKTKAFKSYYEAAWKNHTEAQYALGRCYDLGIGVAVNRSLAFHWYQKAAAANFQPAFEALKKFER